MCFASTFDGILFFSEFDAGHSKFLAYSDRCTPFRLHGKDILSKNNIIKSRFQIKIGNFSKNDKF